LSSYFTTLKYPSDGMGLVMPVVLLVLGAALFVSHRGDQNFLKDLDTNDVEEVKNVRYMEAKRRMNEISEEFTSIKIKMPTYGPAGTLVMREFFAMNSVQLFSNGYIQLSNRGMKAPERLVSISGNTDMMKSQGGRNHWTQGGAILSVLTENGSYTVKAVTNTQSMMTPEQIASLQKIVMMGQALIDKKL
jgi:hypothetical protein